LSSADAKNADAVFKISFARRNSQFAFSNSAIRPLSSLDSPGRRPPSTSARFTQFRTVSVPIPSRRATRAITL
jgi:hypothetical protein